jgi:hypothetical protein
MRKSYQPDSFQFPVSSFQLSGSSFQFPVSSFQLGRTAGLEVGRYMNTRPSPLAPRPSSRPSPLGPRPSLRSAFTLIELTVAVAILLGVLTMVGMIFHTVGEASGKAQSSSVQYRQFMSAADMIHDDLAGIDPASGVIAIAGVEVDAFETEADKAAAIGDPSLTPKAHRADVLMLLTAREFQPFIYVKPSDPLKQFAFAKVKQVVYGHADLGQLDPAAPDTKWAANIKRVESRKTPGGSDMLACQWHLARRVVGFPESVTPPDTGTLGGGQWEPKGVGVPAGIYPQSGGPNGELTGNDILEGRADVFAYPLGNINATCTKSLLEPGLFQYGDADGARLFWVPRDLQDNLGTQIATGKPYYRKNALNGTPWLLRYNEGGEFWWAPDGTPLGWQRYQGGASNKFPLPASPLPGHPGNLRNTGSDTDACGLTSVSEGDYPGLTFYNPKAPQNDNGSEKRTLLPMYSVAGQSKRMAGYFLPACSEFKVEFTYDDPREVLLTGANRHVQMATDLDDNGTPDVDWSGDGTLTDINPSTGLPADAVVGPHPIRWQTVPKGQQWVWSRLSVNPNTPTDPFHWPRALRITLRGYGPRGTAEGAVEQVVIKTW